MPDFEKRADELEELPEPPTTRERLVRHELICGFRWKACNARLSRIEGAMCWAVAVLLVGMAGVITTLILILLKVKS